MLMKPMIERHNDGQGTGHDHLLQRGLGGDGDASGRVGVDAFLALPEPGDLAELAADLFDHLLSGSANGIDGEGREQEGQHGPEEQAGEHVNLANVQAQSFAFTKDGELEALEQCQSGQTQRNQRRNPWPRRQWCCPANPEHR